MFENLPLACTYYISLPRARSTHTLAVYQRQPDFASIMTLSIFGIKKISFDNLQIYAVLFCSLPFSNSNYE